MRKKCLAIAKKAMVWALAASMLVGTPLTASAAGLRDVYKVEDGWGNTIDNEDDTRTGTVSSTHSDSNTTVLKGDAKLQGIVLSETNVKLEMDGTEPKEKTLTVDFDWGTNSVNDEIEAWEAELRKLLTWRSSNNSVVAVRNDKQNGILDELTLVAKAGGTETVTVSLDDNDNNIHYTTVANVTVKQYATGLSFDPALDKEAYEGTSLNLNDYLVRDPKTSNDNVTFALVEDVKKCATLKNGVLKLKDKKAGSEVKIAAIGEKTKGEHTFKVVPANHATKVEIRKAGADVTRKYDWLVNDDGNKNVFEAVLTAKDTSAPCTDTVTWSSKKPSIVDIVGSNKGESVTLVAKAVGKTTITAQASGGKKGTISITVKANMTGFEISIGADSDGTETTLYSGQSLKLNSTQYFNDNGPVNFTDAGLTWSFDGDAAAVRNMKKVASINAKTGVVTIKPDVSALNQIKVTATNSKKIGTTKAKEMKPINGSITIKLEQINITKITVYENMSAGSRQIAGASLKANGTPQTIKGATVAVPVDTSRTYKVVAEGTDKDGNEVKNIENALNWASNNEKLAIATRNANGSGTVSAIKKGTATITVSGATKKGNKYVAIKATFKASVTVPTKTLTLKTAKSGIAATNKPQTITIKATLDKGTTSKAKNIVWSAVKVSADGTKTPVAGADIKNGKLKLKKEGYVAGDKYTVTATLADAGVKTSITLNVVKPSSKVQFVDADGVKLPSTNEIGLEGSLDLQTQVQVNGNWLTPGQDDVAKVKYTLNKSDIVLLVGNRALPIKKGSVKVTATTSDGKKATTTIQVE